MCLQTQIYSITMHNALHSVRRGGGLPTDSDRACSTEHDLSSRCTLLMPPGRPLSTACPLTLLKRCASLLTAGSAHREMQWRRNVLVHVWL